jgi:glucose-6-phosphate isomerase
LALSQSFAKDDVMTEVEAELRRHAAAVPPSIAGMFGAEPDRLARLALDAAGIHFDFSKLAVSAEVLDLLLARAEAADLPGWREKLFAGATVNISEGRAATHMAERGIGAAGDIAAAATGQAAMQALVESVRSGEVDDVIHIGIGGSSLGPALLLDALGRDGAKDARGPRCHVVANIDGEALARVLPQCNPARTRVVIVSKTFTTTETMTNAESAMDWLAAAGVVDPHARAIAVTAAPDKAVQWGVGAVLPFAATVGGRYSLWSAVGLPFALRCGWVAWQALHAGAAAMDVHFRDMPMAANIPVLAGLFDVWAAHYCQQSVRGVFAYDERLRLLTPFLQQLEMESNGKRVTQSGASVSGATAPVTWGGTGTDAQHAVFQLLHQGTVIGPVEFVAVRSPGHAMPATHHRQLLANCFAQGAALMRGRTFDAALALSGGDPALAAAKTFPGNRPSATLLLDRLDPPTLGALLAFYEHRTFVAGVLLGINSFDQWGVELGKEMASAALAGGNTGFDPSTSALMARGFAE